DPALLATVKAGEERPVFLPVGIGRMVVWRPPPARCFAHFVVQPGSGAARRADLRIYDESGGVVAELKDIQAQRVAREALERLGNKHDKKLDDAFYEIAWRSAAAPPVSEPKRGRTFVVFGGTDEAQSPLPEKIRARGDRCVLVRRGTSY